MAIKASSMESEDDYENGRYFVSPPSKRLIVKRDGSSITRQIPKPVVLVDSREQYPFDFDRFPNWIASQKKKKLSVGDYSVEGMEDILIIERKSLTDLITTLMQQRPRFFRLCDKMTKYRWRALFVEATYEDIKSYYGDYTMAHPNAVSGTLDALEAKFGIPVVYTSRLQELAEEKAASWLSKHFTYWYLESKGMGSIAGGGFVSSSQFKSEQFWYNSQNLRECGSTHFI